MRVSLSLKLSPWILGFCVAFGGLSACSSSQEDDENLNSSNNDSSSEGNLGEDDAHEGNGQENFVDNAGDKGGKNGADVNSATGGDMASTESLNTPPANNAAPLANNQAAAPGANAAAPANLAAAPNAAPAAAAPAAAAAAPTDGTSPVAGGRVRYVRSGGVQVMSSPNGKPVTTLEQGDHPVTWEENGWLRLSAGMYVPVDALSEKGVARPAGPRNWTNGSAGAAAH